MTVTPEKPADVGETSSPPPQVEPSTPNRSTSKPKDWITRAVLLAVAVALIAVAVANGITDVDRWRLALGDPIADRQKLDASVLGDGTNGFDLEGARIPRDEIRRGGPPKDGIPALTDPVVVEADQDTLLDDDARVIGLNLNGVARAYPIPILNWHEVVNDTLGQTPVAVTYCPLCDTAAAFDRRRSDGRIAEFGVSGLLYNSNVLMYDRGGEPESLWSQGAASAVSGEDPNAVLDALPLEVTTWSDWRTRHPETTVLAPPVLPGMLPRDYNQNPYDSYFANDNLMFPVDQRDDRLPVKEPVLGLWVADADPTVARAYPTSAFERLDPDGPLEVVDRIDGLEVRLIYDPQTAAIRVTEADPQLRWMYGFWFAWYAFHPETTIYPGLGANVDPKTNIDDRNSADDDADVETSSIPSVSLDSLGHVND